MHSSAPNANNLSALQKLVNNSMPAPLSCRYSRCPLVEKRHCVVNDSASHNKSLKPFRMLDRAIDPRIEPSITKSSKPQAEEPLCFKSCSV
jgi:hypothetical protein